MDPSASEARPFRPGCAPQPPAGDFAELVRNVRSLKMLLNFTVLIMLFFVVLLNAFMLFQVRSMRRQGGDLYNSVVTLQKVASEYETNSVPVMQRFSLDLKRFAERNPDFAPILNRYAGALSSGRPTNAAPQAPAANPAPGK